MDRLAMFLTLVSLDVTSGGSYTVTISDCNTNEKMSLIKMNNYKVRGSTVISEITGAGVPCMQECLKLNCHFVTQVQDESGYTCQFYQKPYISTEQPTTTGVAYTQDYCPHRSALICLPGEFYHFTDQNAALTTNGCEFKNSFDGDGGAFFPALKATYTTLQYALLNSKTVDDCLYRPHTCVDGFTLAMYFKTQPITGAGPGSFVGILTTRTLDNGKDSEGFAMLYRPESGGLVPIEFQVVVPDHIIVTTQGTANNVWVHMTFTYKYDQQNPASTSSMNVYVNGAPGSFNSVSEPKDTVTHASPYELVFGRVFTRDSNYYCKCLIDDLALFPMELDAEAVNQFYSLGPVV